MLSSFLSIAADGLPDGVYLEDFLGLEYGGDDWLFLLPPNLVIILPGKEFWQTRLQTRVCVHFRWISVIFRDRYQYLTLYCCWRLLHLSTAFTLAKKPPFFLEDLLKMNCAIWPILKHLGRTPGPSRVILTLGWYWATFWFGYKLHFGPGTTLPRYSSDLDLARLVCQQDSTLGRAPHCHGISQIWIWRDLFVNKTSLGRAPQRHGNPQNFRFWWISF